MSMSPLPKKNFFSIKTVEDTTAKPVFDKKNKPNFVFFCLFTTRSEEWEKN